MICRWRLPITSVLLLAALNCGSKPESTPSTSPATSPTHANNSRDGDVTGTLAPSVAPPSALIVLEPETGVDLPVKAEPAIMDQSGYAFLPGFLVAQAGQRVQFRNSEDVLHNVRVAEASQQKPVFNVATTAFGSYEHKFEPGYYNVTCDIHPTMRASILVTATPYTATTSADGGFTIKSVIPGKYNLTVYAGATPVTRSVEVKSGQTDLGTIQ
jgi:plastocyanin